VLTAIGCLAYFAGLARTRAEFYVLCGAMGVSCGYWAVFITTVAEQFGTKTCGRRPPRRPPKFRPGGSRPHDRGIQVLSRSGRLGVVGGGAAVGVIVVGLALVAVAGSRRRSEKT